MPKPSRDNRPPIFMPEHVARYIRSEFRCEPAKTPKLVGSTSEWPPVWKVPIKRLLDSKDKAKSWKGYPPRVLYAVAEPLLNAYSPLHLFPHLTDNKDESTLVDHIRTFHLGICSRMAIKNPHGEDCDCEGASKNESPSSDSIN